MTVVPEEWKPGSLVAERYRLLGLVGAGGMGQVWRAHDEALDRVVALKQAHGDEARKGARLQHPNVITLYDVAVHDGVRWLVMEYVPAPSLAALVRERGPLPSGRVARIGAQLAAGLAAIHAQGVVHCDVTPNNVLITDDGTAKLIDFGIAQAAGDAPPRGARRAGTPRYMAAEVSAGMLPTPASDVYSLGATLYAAFTGAPPAGGVVPPTQRSALAQVLSAMLQRRPEARPGAVRAGQMLLAAARGFTLRRRHQLVALAAACLALLVILLPIAASDALPVNRPAGTGAVGNPRSADPCALLDRHSLGRFGSTSLDTADGDFTRCDVVVQSGSTTVDVEANFALSSTEDWAHDTIGRLNGLGVVRIPSDGDGCVRLVRLPGPYMAVVQAKVWDGHSARLCAMADTATTTATAVLARDRLPRRPAPAALSLRRRDACSMLTGQALRAATPGIGTARAEPGYAHWDCTWTGTTSDLWVELSFQRNNVLIDDSNEYVVNIAGHRAGVMPGYEDRSTCSIRLVNRQITDNHGDPALEYAYIEVHGSQRMDTLCRMAVKLARSVVKRLPTS